MIWELPTEVELGGTAYEVRTDFRDVLAIIKELNDPDSCPQIKYDIALDMFFFDYEKIPDHLIEDALNELMKFINCGEEESEDRDVRQRFDWDQDGMMIVSDINKVTGKDIRAEEYMHWWTFVSLFQGIGEGQMSNVIGIRDKLDKGEKLDKYEQEFYRENKSRVDLKKHYSAEEQAERDRLNRMLSGDFT